MGDASLVCWTAETISGGGVGGWGVGGHPRRFCSDKQEVRPCCYLPASDGRLQTQTGLWLQGDPSDQDGSGEAGTLNGRRRPPGVTQEVTIVGKKMQNSCQI